jgi:hypothetical protein
MESIQMFLHRFVLVLAIVITGSLAFAASAIGAGGLGPGNYSFSSRSADAFFGMGSKGGPPAASWSVSVNQGLNSFKPTRQPGPPVVEQNTMVFITEFDAAGNGGFGCFVVPDSAFTVSRDLQTASLHAVLSVDEVCDGYGTAVGGKGGGAFAGGDGGLTLPIAVDVTWTATTATSTDTNVFTFRCLNFNMNGNGSFASVQASATGSISALPGSFTADYTNIASGTNQLHINAEYPEACYA